MSEEFINVEHVLTKSLQSSDEHRKLLEELCRNDNQMKIISELNQQLSGQRIERLHKIMRRIMCVSLILICILGLSVIAQTWFITLGCIEPDPGWYGWLLGHNILLAVTGVSLLGICLAITSRLSRDE